MIKFQNKSFLNDQKIFKVKADLLLLNQVDDTEKIFHEQNIHIGIVL